MENLFWANSAQKQAGIVILIHDNTDFKPKLIKRQKESLHTDKESNPSREYNNCKHIHLMSTHPIS
jgi:hypothetical protein